MATEEERERHSKRRKKEFLRKRDELGDRKGAFSLKPINPKKETYKRERVTLHDLREEPDE